MFTERLQNDADDKAEHLVQIAERLTQWQERLAAVGQDQAGRLRDTQLGLQKAGAEQSAALYATLGAVGSPLQLAQALAEYLGDAAQRGLIFWDVMRKRGNEYIEHSLAGRPPMLSFDYEVLLDAGTFAEHPCNYALVRIVPPAGISVDPLKRPYVIVDPRAGHGAGIGGFKNDSQVGVALRAGHPVYFVIFRPEPVPGQRLADVARAEARFLREVRQRHEAAPKPCIIGNCQGGWAVMGLAAADPSLVGPIVINGAPLSYWAGSSGQNPMRYTGGLTGGSWAAHWLSDLGNGRFDGALLVDNFERLNPGNSYFGKYYTLFENAEQEEARFLHFEKWWGGYSLLNGDEIEAIVDELFVGNHLASRQIRGPDGHLLDLRNIRSPIVVFCSEGDNITPPEQALFWIADLYPDDRAIRAAGQTIVYLRHLHIGHLGIFVSGGIARKEYDRIVGTLDEIERLPPGLYEMLLSEDGRNASGDPRYRVSFAERSLGDLLTLDHDTRAEERYFEVVRAVSEFNRHAYELFAAPLIKAGSSEFSAELSRQALPLRVAHYGLSDFNPWLLAIKPFAEAARAQRQAAAVDNPFVLAERAFAHGLEAWMNLWGRDLRDNACELAFYGLYGWLAALGVGLDQHAPAAAEQRATEDRVAEFVDAHLDAGGARGALLRMLVELAGTAGELDAETLSGTLERARATGLFEGMDSDTLRQLVHAQSTVLAYAHDAALDALPRMLADPAERARTLQALDAIVPLDLVQRPNVAAAIHDLHARLPLVHPQAEATGPAAG
ncbi:DUF3141 domain-containing protein [Plasticicumulans acidivorans]|uniref:Uncharacterized protein DUF3141 n=1 Tax=Plasticicumulans acidivorans TaxID=886464 RepID=A0A317MZB7_9GAMM|nr:DUF3141 domain-containing protein [Plasticicumulans acidivorans]PWV65575.1 uncharacterized protein DUF3141 [Plasticicumulans acidivorans]